MDDFGLTRRALMHQLPEALQSAEQHARAKAAGQNDMFGLELPAPLPAATANETLEIGEWPQATRLANEKEALGLYLTGHPFHAVRGDARNFVDGRLADLANEPPPLREGERAYARRDVSIAGLVVDVRKRGNRVSVVLDDDTGRMEVGLFNEAFQEFRHLLVKDEIVVVSGTLRYDDFLGAWSVNAKGVVHIDRVIESRAQSMLLRLAPNGHGEQLLTRLHDVLLPHREGNCEVAVQYYGDSAAARLNLGPEWAVRPSRDLRDKLTELLGAGNVRLVYAPGREIM
jgi:DNA polymerase-3 subunit alpha